MWKMQITSDQLSEFQETGLLVIEDVFSPDEVHATREAFHEHLNKLDIDHQGILAGKADIPGYRIKSPVSRIFYPKWKLLDIHLNPKVVNLTKDLLVKTYGSDQSPDFVHPYEQFKDIFAYVDRICWRLPDCIREEGGLGLHLDRNPVDPFLLQGKGLTKWRPIQSFVCLTDHFSGESGGLKVVPGFHKRIDTYFKDKVSTSDGGEFYRLNSSKHNDLQSQCRPVTAPAGSMVFWDNRLPHATAARLSGIDTREVIYTGFLPDIDINRRYVSDQCEAIKNNRPPPAYVENDTESSDRDWEFESVTKEQQSLLGFNLQHKVTTKKAKKSR